ncbi:MAG TPA: hypothetical protein VGD80_41985 [Kofleriaceae bacterium]
MLDTEIAAMLSRPLLDVDRGVAHVQVAVAPDHNGEDALFFRVVLKDDPTTAKPSAELGKRLQKIASALRERAASLKLTMFGYVDWVLESELPRPKRKSA